VEHKDILYSKENFVGTITLNRPQKHNALTQDMLIEMRRMLLGTEADDEVRVVVIKGAGGKAFSSGFDLSPDRGHKPQNGIEWRAHLQSNNNAFQTIWEMGKPVIAQVQGHCLAGAFDMMTACDLVVCTENSMFGEPEILFGGTSQYLMLPYVIDLRICKQLMLTGEKIDAQTALRANLVNYVVSEEEIDTVVANLCGRMCKLPYGTLQLNKRALNRAYDLMGVPEAVKMSLDAAHYSLVCKSAEAQAFNDVVAEKGLKAAFAWRDEKFGKS
jgi:enoyl-CoA hydratase